MAEADAAAPVADQTTPAAAAAPDQPKAAKSFDDVFGAEPEHEGKSFDSVFGAEPAPTLPFSLDATAWKTYLRDAPAGRIISAFGEPLTGPGLSDEAVNTLRPFGVGQPIQEKAQENTDSFAQAIMRPIVTNMRGFNELMIRIATIPLDVVSRIGAGLEGAAAQAGQELGDTAVQPDTAVARAHPGIRAGIPGAQQFGRDVAGMIDTVMTYGHILPGGVPFPKLPEAVAKARSSATIGEGEAGYFGTGETTAEDVKARADAAGDHPIPVREETAAAAEITPEVSGETAQALDVHQVARQIAPDTFREFDKLTAQREDLARWMRDLPDQTRANIEASPPQPLRDLDAEIAATQKKFDNAGARNQNRLGDDLQDLHDRRADLLDDLVRQHPDIAVVRDALQKTDYRMRDLAPDVSAAYREARTRVPEEPPAAEPSLLEQAKSETTGGTVSETTPEQKVETPEPVGETPAETAPETAPSGPVTTPEMLQGIADDVKEKLIKAGRPEEEAQAAGQIIAAHYGSRAERMGGALGSAQQLYDREGPAIYAGMARKRPRFSRIREFAQAAFHGSPHIFDQFTLDHIGKGEGAQAYGHGLYFAGNKAVAKFYRQKLSGAEQPFFRGEKVDRGTFLGQAILTLKNDAAKVGFEDARTDVLNDLRSRLASQETAGRFALDEKNVSELRDAIAKIEGAKEGDTKAVAGRLYHVELAPDDADWLDHDKPLGEQSDKVKAALESLGIKATTAEAVKAAERKYHELSNQYDALPPNRRGEVATDLQRAKSELHEVVTRSQMTGRGAYDEIVHSTGNRAAASEALKNAGIPGIKYFDGSSRGRGAGNHNFVVFDPNDITIKEYEQSQKGSITFAPDAVRAVIKLFRDADASTFIHESGHLFLEEMLRDAEHEAAPADLKADAVTVRKWLGQESGAIKTPQHEKFARGFERYLMEGRAPSTALVTVFEKFKDWLTDIYQTVARLKSPINDDIRDVFDRLLAKPSETATIAPELPLERGLADRHEALPPGADAEQVHRETAAEARARAQEIVDELRLRRGEPGGTAGSGAPQHPGSDGGQDATGSNTGAAGGVSQPGEIVPGRGAAAAEGVGPERPPAQVGPNKAQRLYARVPRRPPSLADWIKARGGIREDNGEVSAVTKDNKKPGLIKPDGLSIHKLAVDAERDGFFPETQGRRPTDQEFLDKLDEDVHGRHQWSENDSDAVATYQAALDHNAEVDRIANELNIETKGLTHGEFWDTVADRLSTDQAAKELESLGAAQEAAKAEAERAAQEFLESRGEAWEPDVIYGHDENPRTEVDLEHERAAEESARGSSGRPVRVEQRDVANADQGDVSGRVRQGERDAGSAGRAEPEGGESGPVGAPVRLSDGDASAAASHLGETGYNPEAPWVTAEDGKDLAGNIRLENLRTTDDVDDLLRAWAKSRDDLMEARHNEESYRGQIEVEAARALLCDVAASTLEAERKLAETGSEADAITLMQWRDRLNMVGDKVATLAAGAGRTLAAFKKMDGVKQIMARLEGRTLFQLQAEARLNGALDTPGQLARAVKQQSLTSYQKGRGMLIEYYVNNLISGPITHGAYLVSNLVTALTKAGIEVPLAAAIRRGREIVAGHPIEGVHLSEAKAMWLSLGKGFSDGLPAAWKALKSGTPGLLEGEETQPQLPYDVVARSQHAIPGILGDVLNAPSNVVTGIHTLGRTVNYEMEKAALIARQATKEGLTGADWNRRVAELDQSTPLNIMRDAAAEATKMVLMDRAKWGGVTSKIANLSNSFLPLKLSLPFVQVGANLLHGGLVERTPLGLFEQQIRDNLSGKNGAAARDIQAGKIATGTAIAVGIYALAAQGLVTGSQPKNPNEAALWRMSGKQEYSIRFGDHWVPYRKFLGWYGPLVGMAANVHQVGHTMSDEGLAAGATAAVFGFSEVVADESWFRGISDFVEAAKNWDTKGERYIRNLGTNFIPFSVGMSQVAHLVDPYMRRATGFQEQALAKMPGLSETLQAHRDVFGEPLASHMIITPTRINDDSVIRAMQAVNIWPREVDKKIRGVELTPQQYDDYSRIAGRLMKSRLDAMVNIPGWDAVPGHLRRERLQHAITASRDAARSAVIAQSQGGSNDIMAQARAAKVNERADYDER